MSNTKEQESPLLPTKSQMVDSSGRPMTQSLFLETQYSVYSIYTLKDDDHEYNGKLYPSIKKLYLATEDPTEYIFATTYLLGIKHWYRIYENKLMQDHIDQWRFELELKLRSKGVRQLISAANKGSQSAAKFLVDKGWADRAAGRPSKEELAKEKKIRMDIEDEYADDFKRLVAIK